MRPGGPWVHVDRLAIRAPGADPAQGRRLGELVGRQLGPALPGARPSRVSRLQLRLDQVPGEGPDALAARIAAEVAASLEAGRWA
jgi:hypothetical protein